MNFFDRIVYRLAEWRATAGGSFHVSQTPPGWVDRFGGGETASGEYVTEETALNYSAVYACVRILAETLASMPWVLFEQVGRFKARAKNHPLYPLLHSLPNPEMSSLEFRETLMGHLGTWGNAYAEIEYDRRGQITALWPLRPDRMAVARVDGKIVYEYRLSQPDSQGRLVIPLQADQVFHLRGLSYDGLIGYSPVALARQSIGLGQATEKYGSKFFGNGARPGGVLQHPGKLSDTAYERLKKSFEQRHQGLDNANRLAILEEGMKYEQIGVPPEEAQFLETRTFQVREIARWYRIPPHMLADLDRATFSNIEHLSIEFVQYTMLPWFSMWEQAAYRSLLLPRERDRYYAQFVVAGLLRGDIQSRYAAYATARQNGWMSANDIRELEDMNPVEGGDVYLVPLNMVPADQLAPRDEEMGEGDPDDDGAEETLPQNPEPRTHTPEIETRAAPDVTAANERRALAVAWFGTYQATAKRVLKREAQDITAAARRYLAKNDQAGFTLWLNSFYQEHLGYVQEQFAPLADGYGALVMRTVVAELGGQAWNGEDAEAWIIAYLQSFAARHCGIGNARVGQAVADAPAGEELAAVEGEVETWPEARAVDTARWESVRFNNALAVGLYTLAGVIKLRWRAFGENCPYCSSLNGKTVGISEYFIHAGVDFQPDGAEKPLSNTGNIRHAPAHDGCDCMVTAG